VKANIRVFRKIKLHISKFITTFFRMKLELISFSVTSKTLPTVVNKFCSQHDLTKIPTKSDTEQKAYDTYAAKNIKENAVSNSYETKCMLSSKARTL